MRNSSIDTLGGIMIYFMIFRHCFIGTSLDSTFLGGCLSYYPLMFYMGWFFYKGGNYFNDTSLSITIDKGFRRLLIPYLCFSLIAICIELVTHGLFEGIDGVEEIISELPIHLKREGAITSNAPLWFLFSLFFVRIFYAFFVQIHIPNYLIALFALSGSFLLYRADLSIGIYFENILLGLFFYSIGCLIKKKQYDNRVFYISCAYFIIFLIYAFVNQDIICEFRVNTFSPYIPTILFSISGCIVANNIFVRFQSLKNHFLATVGQNSMIYFTTHFIIIRNLHYLNDHSFHLSQAFLFIITLTSVFALLPLLARFFSKPQLKWMINGPTKSIVPLPTRETFSIVAVCLVFLLMTSYVLIKSFS